MINVLVGLVLLGLLLWAVNQLPLDPAIRQIIRVVAIVAAVYWVLRALGLV